MLFATFTRADQWKVLAATIPIQIPANTSYRVEMKTVAIAGGAQLNSAQSTVGTTVGQGTTVNYSMANQTQTQDFKVIMGYTDLGTNNFIKNKWVGAFNATVNPTGTNEGGTGGGYWNDNDEPNNNNGSLANDDGTPATPTGYKEKTTVNNNDDKPMKLRITKWIDSNGDGTMDAIASQTYKTLPPNSSISFNNNSPTPFGMSYDYQKDYDADTDTGGDWSPIGGGGVHNASSTGGSSGGSTSTGGSVTPTTTKIPTPTTATPTSQPGTGGGVLESNQQARHTDMMKELLAARQMQKTVGDFNHTDNVADAQKQDLQNSLLKDIKTGIDGVKANTEGGTGGGTGGEGDGEVTVKEPTGPGVTLPDRDVTQAANAASGMGGNFAQLQSDVSAFANKLTGNLATSADLTWNLSIMGQNYTLSLTPYMSYFTMIRNALLAIVAVGGVMSGLTIIRGALVDGS